MEFEKQLERARQDGVGRQENLPFLLTPPGPCKAGIVLVHGFSASPWETRFFGEQLARDGFQALGIRLPGHGTNPEDLEKRTYEQWLDTVTEGCRLMSARHRRVYGLGMSTGALLLLAARQPLAGMILLSPFLRLQHPLGPAAGLLRHLMGFKHMPVEKELLPFYYARRPLAGVHQLNLLAAQVSRCLPQIQTPALVIAAEGDRTVNVESGLKLFRRLGSTRKEYHRFGPEVPHVLTTRQNPRLEQTYQMCWDFIHSLQDKDG